MNKGILLATIMALVLISTTRDHPQPSYSQITPCVTLSYWDFGLLFLFKSRLAVWISTSYPQPRVAGKDSQGKGSTLC